MVVAINKQQSEKSDNKSHLRLWLQLLQTTRFLENEIRDRLRRNFGVTLARFDVMAALYKNPDGLMMSQLSKHLMVSNGNVTGLVDRMIDDGMAERSQRDGNRRSWYICLSDQGTRKFSEMAAIHETWVNELLASFSDIQAQQLHAQLSKLYDKQAETNE